MSQWIAPSTQRRVGMPTPVEQLEALKRRRSLLRQYLRKRRRPEGDEDKETQPDEKRIRSEETKQEDIIMVDAGEVSRLKETEKEQNPESAPGNRRGKDDQEVDVNRLTDEIELAEEQQEALDDAFKREVIFSLLDQALSVPIFVSELQRALEDRLGILVDYNALLDCLEELASKYSVLAIDDLTVRYEVRRAIGQLDRPKLELLYSMLYSGRWKPLNLKRPRFQPLTETAITIADDALKSESLELILSKPSTREKAEKKALSELMTLIDKKSWRETKLQESFKSDLSNFRHYCQYSTREECKKARNRSRACGGLHFRRIIKPHTDVALGDCSYLDTCRHMKTCKYVHYEIDTEEPLEEFLKKAAPKVDKTAALTEPQWINCDVRKLDWSLLGKFDIIMADPPWDIHMELPYGTMSDDEMRAMPIASIQDDGFIFLWVTGRAMELGRELLELWGYERVEEIVWIKTNQLMRLIRTGRTGHWLNHSKEHCIVGRKGNPKYNQHIDCDVILAEVRETSRKPDEIYHIAERLMPLGRKLEIFGRPHNRVRGWITLGNQLPGTHVVDPAIDVEKLMNHLKEIDPQARQASSTIS